MRKKIVVFNTIVLFTMLIFTLSTSLSYAQRKGNPPGPKGGPGKSPAMKKGNPPGPKGGPGKSPRKLPPRKRPPRKRPRGERKPKKVHRGEGEGGYMGHKDSAESVEDAEGQLPPKHRRPPRKRPPRKLPPRKRPPRKRPRGERKPKKVHRGEGEGGYMGHKDSAESVEDAEGQLPPKHRRPPRKRPPRKLPPKKSPHGRKHLKDKEAGQKPLPPKKLKNPPGHKKVRGTRPKFKKVNQPGPKARARKR